MTWLKLDDKMYTHPKIHPLSSRAFRVHVGGLLSCAHQLTDGVVTLAALYGLSHPDLGDVESLAAELVDSGLWRPNGDRTWLIHDYLEYNPTRAEVLAKREEERVRRAKNRAAAANRKAERDAAVLLGQRNGQREGDPFPSGGDL